MRHARSSQEACVIAPYAGHSISRREAGAHASISQSGPIRPGENKISHLTNVLSENDVYYYLPHPIRYIVYVYSELYNSFSE